nr:YkgJ family cysteine cluster protein [Desulfobulbaceae bacterium]
MSSDNKKFPEGMVPLGKSKFAFRCYPEVPCYTDCCRKLELFLYPYDVIRLKNSLGINSEEFLNRYAGVVSGGNPLFPSVILRMLDNDEHTCPFLNDSGCAVYEDRPSACRTYPLERAVDRQSGGGRPEEFYFMTNHPYCKGHNEPTEWSVPEWLRDQHLLYYNMMDDLWADLDTLFRSNPWQNEGAAGPLQQMAFMACYNVDGFRKYAVEAKLFDQFKLSKAELKSFAEDDEALLRFGFKWLLYFLGNKPVLKARPRR